MRAKTCTAFVALLLGVCLALAACGADRPMTGLRVTSG